MTRNSEKDRLKLAAEVLRGFERSQCEFGSWGQDDKRPFGNSGHYSIARDIAEIIEMPPEGTDGPYPQFTDEQVEYALDLYNQLGDVWKRLAEQLDHEAREL